jgi:hypothetical protein
MNPLDATADDVAITIVLEAVSTAVSPAFN